MSDEKRRPLGTIQELRDFYRNPAQTLCCHEPGPPKVIGCPLYDECPHRQKGVSGPVNVAQRLYKPGSAGALVRENYGPCYEMIDATTQYNRNEGYFREILGYGKGEDPGNPNKVVTIRQTGTRKKVGGAPDEWEYWEKDVEVPAFIRLKDRPEMRNQVRARELVEQRAERRRDAGIDATLQGGRQKDVARAMASVDMEMETEGMEKDDEKE